MEAVKIVGPKDIIFTLPDPEMTVKVGRPDRFSSTGTINIFPEKAYSIRRSALELHPKRIAIIDIGLTDPNPFVRLGAGNLLAKTWIDLCDQGNVAAVIQDLDRRLNSEPQLYFRSRDSRLGTTSFSPKAAKDNMRLGVFMALQSALVDGNYNFIQPITEYFRTNGFISRVNQITNDSAFAQKLIDNKFELPEMIKNPKNALDNFFLIVDYAIALGCLSKAELKDKYYPNIQHDCNFKTKYYQRVQGVLNCIASIFQRMEQETHNEPALSIIQSEQRKVVGQF